MDQSYQLHLFILSTTTLFTDIKPVVSQNWFDAQKQCLGPGLTIEKNKSNQPYWTGNYRRLTPLINILGCYSDSMETLQDVVKKTMIMGSVGMCQEMCYHDNGYKFGVQMKSCLCIKHNVYLNTSNENLPSACNYKCEDNSNVIPPVECGGERAYSIFEFQEVNFTSTKTCLSLQCSRKDTRFIPQECSTNLDKICKNWRKPDNGYASNWSSSMEQCKNSNQPHYLLGNIRLNDSRFVCDSLNYKVEVVWVGVARQFYTSIDKGLEITDEQRETFLECQMCTNDDCQFRSCTDLSTSSIFCKGTPGSGDDLVLKISFPLLLGFIFVSISAVGVVYYTRKFKTTKTDRTTKVEVESEPRKNVDSDVDYVQSNTYFELEHCPQGIPKGNDSSNESPYNNTEEGVYDHLRDKKSRKTEVEDTYQHATGTTGDMSEYDTMANAVNKKQDEEASYDYSHQDAKETCRSNLRTNNLLIDNPYNVATPKY